jgi:Aspartyl protease
MIHLSIVRPHSESTAALQARAILVAAAVSRRVTVCRPVVRTSSPPRLALRYFVLALLLLTPLPNRARSGALRIPFRTVHSMIIVQAKVNGAPVQLLLDTGATRTIVNAGVYGEIPFRLRSVEHSSSGPGIVGDSVVLPINLELAHHIWAGQHVAIMNLDGLSQIMGMEFDGLLGQDVLRNFRSVRIDYRAHVIELEE